MTVKIWWDFLGAYGKEGGEISPQLET